MSALLGTAAALILAVQVSGQDRNDCRCEKVTASAGTAQVTGVGGLVTDGVLELELTREFSFKLECDGTTGECVERVGVDATGMSVDLSDKKGNAATLAPNAGSETTKNASFIVIDCTCKDKGGCETTKKVKVVYGAKFDVPQWAIDDLAAKPPVAVTATVSSTWTPKSETEFCEHATAAGYEAAVTTRKELKIKSKD